MYLCEFQNVFGACSVDSRPKEEVLPSKMQNVFVLITNVFFQLLNFKVYLSKFRNVSGACSVDRRPKEEVLPSKLENSLDG